MLALPAGVAEGGDRGGGIGLEPVGEGGIAPGAGDDAGAVAGADLGLIGVDDDVDGGWVDQALDDEDGFERTDAGGHRVEVVVVIVVIVVVIVGHEGRLLPLEGD